MLVCDNYNMTTDPGTNSGTPELSKQPWESYDKAALMRAFDHVKMLWDDQVTYSDTLNNKRRTLSTLILILIGLGAIKFDLDATHAQMTRWIWVPFRLSLAVAAVSFLGGVVSLYFEAQHLLDIRNLKARVGQFAQKFDSSLPTAPFERRRRRAIARLMSEHEGPEDWMQLTEEQSIFSRTGRLYQAYDELGIRNDNINRRLQIGVWFLGIGCFFVVVAVLICITASLV